MEKSSTCTFTGHRENKLPWRGDESDPRCLRLKEHLTAALESAYAAGMRHFICGMANGADMYFGEAVVRLREAHPEVTLEAAVPWEGQAESWTPEQKKRYDRLLTECDYLTVVQHNYSPGCMMRRNRFMVDSAAMLIAAYSGAAGGTRSTLLYAMRQGLQITELPMEL